MKKSSSTLEGLFLDEDSPYALSGNVQELLGATRALGVPRPTAQTYLRGEPTFTLHRPQRQRFPRSKTVVALPSIIPGKPIWWKCRTQNWSKPIVAHVTCSPLSTLWASMPGRWALRVNTARPCAMGCAICWKTNRHNAAPSSCRPIRVKSFTTNTSNGCWTSMASTTIPPPTQGRRGRTV